MGIITQHRCYARLRSQPRSISIKIMSQLYFRSVTCYVTILYSIFIPIYSGGASPVGRAICTIHRRLAPNPVGDGSCQRTGRNGIIYRGNLITHDKLCVFFIFFKQMILNAATLLQFFFVYSTGLIKTGFVLLFFLNKYFLHYIIKVLQKVKSDRVLKT